MVNSLSTFVSIFNYGYLSRKRSVFVPNSNTVCSVLHLLKEEGYIMSYAIENTKSISVVYNFSASPFTLSLPPKTSKRFLNIAQLRSSLNSGRLYILRTSSGVALSKFCLVSNIGGSVILEIKHFLQLINFLHMHNKIRIFKDFEFYSLSDQSIVLYSSGNHIPNPLTPVYHSRFVTSKSNLGSCFSNFKNFFSSQFGYYSALHVKGIGFKVFYYAKEHTLYFSLGFNHLVKFKLDRSVFVKVRKQYVLLFSNDKGILGQSIYNIRHLRFPDPYRGKGVRYRFQVMKFKPGKQR